MESIKTICLRLEQQVPGKRWTYKKNIMLEAKTLTVFPFFDLGFGWVVAAAVDLVGVWGVWTGPGLVWMGCVVFAVAMLWEGLLLAAGHQSSIAVCCCW